MTDASPPLRDAPRPIVLQMENIYRKMGGKLVLSNLNLTLHAGEVLTVIGGSAPPKNALTRLLSGQQYADGGRIYRNGPAGPGLSTNMGFNVGGTILRGLEMRAAAYGVDFEWYVDAVADYLPDPDIIRKSIEEIGPSDRLALLYGSSMLLPCTTYVNQSGPLPADKRAKKAVRPIFREARKRAAFVGLSKRLKIREAFKNQRFLRLHAGALLELDEFEQVRAERQAARAETDTDVETETA